MPAWETVVKWTTFSISLIGFGLSVYNFVHSLITSRENYVLDIIDYEVCTKRVTQFLVCFSNKSDSPLSIISVSYDGTICELEPKKIKGFPTDWNFQSSPRFPLCVPARGCQYAYLEFVSRSPKQKPLSPHTAVNFEIRSTRKLVQKTVSLPEKSHYLHTRV